MSATTTTEFSARRQPGWNRAARRGLAAAAVGLIGAVLLNAHPASADGRRKTICHIPHGNPHKFSNLTVSAHEAWEHLRHGDFDGPCEHDCNLNPDDCRAFDKCSVATCDTSTGQCQITPKICPDTQCTRGQCNPWTGGCVGLPLTGNACNDGDACTTKDRCRRGRCVGKPLSCDDQNQCTADSCDGTLGCQNIPTAACAACNGPADCQDGNLCNGVEQCVAGQCVPGAPPTCVSTEPCLTAGCDPTAGCTLTPNTNACSDANPCTAPDTCGNGTCQPGPEMSCDDGNPCTVDSCDPSLGGCQNTFIVGCSPCQTDADCGGDQCNPQFCQDGRCASLPPPVCDDRNPCTADGCDPATGCFNTPLTGNQCAPGDACSGFSSCQNGVCTPVSPLACDDGNPCTIDTCNAAGCSFSPGNDGAACTTAAGQPGACLAGSCLQPSCEPCALVYMQCVYQSGLVHGFGPDWCNPAVCGANNCLDVAMGIFGAENPIGADCAPPCALIP